ncbi:MAG: cofactor-independent phosphoglycerate mutase [Candidatus Hadarchaeota archaeon]|nr:cofactor-independent phosphoglycerate mutase [Candidatus Hadarchaeota archaeon]
MKYIVIVGDGMADRPLEELGGKTPLQVADKPNMNRIASNGRSGLLKNVPKGMHPESNVAMMSILGYDPRKYHTGRGPLEAAGMDVKLGKSDVAFRCNLITEGKGVMEDYSADHVTTEEAEGLMEVMKGSYGHLGDFYVGVSYRHLFVMRNPPKGLDKLRAMPPHEIVGEELGRHLIRPRNLEFAKILNGMILDSRKILSPHPINIRRIKKGRKPANMIWVWGQGRKPKMKTLNEKYGINGAIISAVNVVKGLGVCAGMDKIDVPGATGYYDTNYENKAKFGLKALEDHDLILIHVEAPDEAGHAGDVEKKIEAIENLDRRLIKKFLDGMKGEYTISITADHPTPINVRGHVLDPVPFAIYSTEGQKDDIDHFGESLASRGSFGTLEGHRFMDKLIQP